MDTVTYQRVFERMASLAGLDPLQVDDHTWRQWRNLADFRLGSWLWNAAEWPELRVDAELALSNEVDSEGAVQRRLASVPAGAAAVVAVHNYRPEDERSRELRYRLVETAGTKQVAVAAGATDRATIWVTYRVAAPNLFGDVYDGERSYAAGDQVFYGSDFYNCVVAAGVNENPSAYPAKWARVEIPQRFAEALARGVIADWPANEDARMEEKAAEALTRIILDLENQEQQSGQMQVVVN